MSQATTNHQADAQDGRRHFLKTLGAAALASTAGAPVLASPAPARPAGGITGWSATELSRAIHGGQVSCAEVMGAYLDQIDRLNPVYNAIVSLQPREQLLAAANEADRQAVAARRTGARLGWMHGFPQAPKDLAATAGIVTTSGSPLFKDYVPKHDAIIVERARQAGAILIGKTNTPEFGLGSHTYNPVFGTTVNAFDPARSAGGSSGGAAVALALDMLPVADGSDMMGSLRNPAAWNNIFGFRPSFGRVPFGPTSDVFMQQLGYEGPMGRNVADLAMLLSIQAGFDRRAPLSIAEDPAQFAQPLQRNVKGMRIGWLGDFNGYLPMDPGVMDTCVAALENFRTLGCEVEAAQPAFDMNTLWQTWLALRSSTIAGGLGGLYRDPAKQALFKPEAIWEIENGLKLSAMDIQAAAANRTAWYKALETLFQQYDYLVLPSAQMFPFDARQHWPKTVGGREMDTYHRWMEVVIGGSLGGLPVLNVPAGFGPDGLPMGLQVMGPAHADLAVLQLGHAYEQASGYTRRRSPALG
ncbi:amidase [Kerstersia sp.]|uniref:amidase n=1 Tax=Kerstersia sp. TaxID=1930783 RepID=UPI003F910594